MRQAVFLASVLVCIVAHVAILVSVVRRASASASAEVPKPKRFVEILWALIPAFALALVLAATWVHVRSADTAVTPPSGISAVR